MGIKRIDLIIHPVRFRILQTLSSKTLTTQEIADRLPDVARSSIYRHLRLLLEGDIVAVAQTRDVHGIQEKRYQLAQPPRLGPGDLAGLTAEDHAYYFSIYALSLIRGFADYAEAAVVSDGWVDMLSDRAGYTEVSFFANNEELDVLSGAINEAIRPLLGNPPGDGRRRQKIAVITHPNKER